MPGVSTVPDSRSGFGHGGANSYLVVKSAARRQMRPAEARATRKNVAPPAELPGAHVTALPGAYSESYKVAGARGARRSRRFDDQASDGGTAPASAHISLAQTREIPYQLRLRGIRVSTPGGDFAHFNPRLSCTDGHVSAR